MQDEGLQNFSFEVLEVCPREQLDEKEKYYIELYQSVIYGYNILTGAINRR
jgi:group I intron endonuclease